MEKKVVMVMGLWVIGLMILQVSNGDITCEEAIAALNPCLSYLAGTDPRPNPACCLAVENVNREATTTLIRRNLCVCFKQAGPSFGVKPDKAKQLPDLCHVQLPVPIDPSIDCSKIQ